MPELAKLDLNLIDPPSIPIRASLDERLLEELKHSMHNNGLLQPIGVKLREGRYEIEFGHRRYLAAVSLGWKKIPALVFADQELAEHAAKLAENIHRERLNAAEEAIWFSQLMEAKKWDTDALASALLQSRPYVEERLKLLAGDAEIFRALVEKRISFAVARELNKCPDETHRRYLLHHASLEQIGHKRVAVWVAEYAARSQPPVAIPVETAPAAEVEAESAPAVGCALCGGARDPWNLVSIMLHRWEWEHIQEVFLQSREAPVAT